MDNNIINAQLVASPFFTDRSGEAHFVRTWADHSLACSPMTVFPTERPFVLFRWLTLSLLLFLAACQKKDVVIPEPDPTPVPTATGGRDDNMALGNPSNAVPSVVAVNNHLILHPQFALGYDNSRGTARWVSWHLNMDWKGNATRCDCFEPDPLLPSGYFAAITFNYSNTGFDRGHLCPSDDRDGSATDNAATFLLTNITPQAPEMNQQTWASLESFARDLAADGNELYIVAGSYGEGGTGSQGAATSIAGGAITVPARWWKVLVVIPEGDNDTDRINVDGARVIAVDIPNTQNATAHPWYYYRTTVDAIEQSTGLDLLNALPFDVQESLENELDAGLVW